MDKDNIQQSCNRCDSVFVLEPDDISFYKKMKVPNPNVCPDCRFKMRSLWRNEMTLYSGRKCSKCGKGVVSMYNPKSPYTIFCNDCFTRDSWDARDYAVPYDKNRSVIDQMKDFLIKVPKNCLGMSPAGGQIVNSDYINMSGACKNCYLIFNTSPAEELLYSRGVRNGRDSSDIYFGVDFERCYDCISVQQSSGVFFGKNVFGCVDCYFVLNGSGLTNCFGCVNLKNKSNCWFNEQLDKETYTKRLKEVLGSHKKLKEARKKFEDFALNFPQRSSNNLKTVNSTGDYLFSCKNVKNAFEASNSEDCKYIFSSKDIKDSIGTIGFGTNSVQLLECVATGLSSNIIGSYWTENSQNIIYGFDLRNCTDCICCDALKNGKYCIFNKEYTKEEYEELKEIIINDLKENKLYGLIMPPELAPFAYNETIAQDNIPLTKEEAISQGYKWEDDIQKTEGKETINPEDIPDNILEVTEDITKEVLRCIDCSRNYKITAQEFLFYRKNTLPIPRKCFFCRHKDRIIKRGPYKFWDRNCAKCTKQIITNYAPERPEIVYCESCYQQEVY